MYSPEEGDRDAAKNDGAPHAGAVLCIARRAHAENGPPHVLLCLLRQALNSQGRLHVASDSFATKSNQSYILHFFNSFQVLSSHDLHKRAMPCVLPGTHMQIVCLRSSIFSPAGSLGPLFKILIKILGSLEILFGALPARIGITT